MLVRDNDEGRSGDFVQLETIQHGNEVEAVWVPSILGGARIVAQGSFNNVEEFAFVTVVE